MNLEPSDEFVECAEKFLSKFKALMRDSDVFVAEFEFDHVREHEFARQIAATSEHVGYF